MKDELKSRRIKKQAAKLDPDNLPPHLESILDRLDALQDRIKAMAKNEKDDNSVSRILLASRKITASPDGESEDLIVWATSSLIYQAYQSYYHLVKK